MYTFFSYIKDTIDDIRVLDRVLSAKEQFLSDKYKYPDFNIKDLKYLIYRDDLNGGLTLAKYLKGLNIPESHIVVSNKAEDFFDHFNKNIFDIMLLWYGPSETNITSILQEVYDTREPVQIPVLVFCAGGDSYNAFIAQASYLYVDYITELPKLRINIKQAIEKSIHNFYNLTLFTQALNQIRVHIKHIIKYKISLLSEEKVTQYLNIICDHPHANIWGYIEKAYLMLIEKKNTEALEFSKNILTNFSKILGTHILYVTALARKYNDINPSVKYLIMHIRQRKDINVEKLHKLANLFIRWKNLEGLEQILEYWYMHSSLPKSAEFDYVLGSYYNLKKDYENALVFIKSALYAKPYKTEYLEGFALVLEHLQKYEQASQIWEAYRKLNTQNIEGSLGLIRCYKQLKESAKADIILNQLLEQYGEHPFLIKLKS